MDVQVRQDQPLEDRYRLDELIADKQFITTYVAYDLAEEKVVAVDILKKDYCEEQSFAADFYTRMQTLAQVQHPNLPAVFHVGTLPSGHPGGQPFAVREYIAGHPLTERLQQLARQGLPVYSIYALRLVRQVADALLEAEQFKLFHHALTPNNILLKTFTMKSNDAVVVLDMGLPIQAPASQTSTNHRESSLAYFAPEQLAQEAADSRSHVYSLGVLLFELLTGERPLKIEAFWEPYIRPIIRSRTSLQKVRDDLAPETYALVNKCLRREPWQRFSSVATFIEALDAAILAEDVQIRTTAEAVFIPRRSPRPFVMVLATVILIAGASAFLLRDVSSGEINPTRMSQTAAFAANTNTATPEPELVVVASTATAEAPVATNTAAPSETATPTASPTELLATASPTATATATALPTETATATPLPQVRIVFSSASVRNGPGVIYETVAYMLEGETAVVIGRNQTADLWYNIILDNGTRGWVAGSVIEGVSQNDLNNIPVASTIPAPPTPTMTATPTPLPLATSTPEQPGGDAPKPRATSTQPPLP